MIKRRSFLFVSIVVLLASIQVFATGSNFVEVRPTIYANNMEFVSTIDAHEGPANYLVEEWQLEESDIELEELENEPDAEMEISHEIELYESGLHINGVFGDIPDMEFHEVIEDDTIITSTTPFLNRNVLYLGDLTIDAIVNVNNSNLVVLGTLNIENNGNLTVSNGNIYIWDDFRIQSRNIDGSFGETNGRVNISGVGRVTVLGDFYAQITNSMNVGTSGAILELYGNFYQVGTNTFFRGLDGFTVVFSGDEQRVSFDRFDANATLYSIAGANGSRRVIFDTPVWQIIPTEETTIFGDNVTFNTIRHSSHIVNIYGDFIARTAGSIQSELIVNGSFYATNGFVTSQADITVKQDLRHQAINEDGTYGITNGALSMSPGRTVTVFGDFYTQSTAGAFSGSATLELHGDFHQIGTDTRFVPQDFFTLAFAGSEQRVSFDRFDNNATLARISGADESRKVYFDTPVWRIIPTENAVIYGDSVTINIIGNSNYTVTINGDFVARTAAGIQSELVVNGSFYATNGIVTSQVDVTIKQDLRHQSINEDGTYGITNGALSLNPGRKVTVLGNFYSQSTAGFFSSAATMELHGNFSQIGADTRFAPMHSFNLVFAGTEHRVSFDRHDSNAILRGVSGANGQRRVYLDTPIHAVWLAEDSVFHGDSSVTFLHPDWNTAKFMGSLENLREIQNGNLYIHGDFESVYNTLIGHESTVIVNGNVYLHNGLWLGNPTSRLSVRGNMFNGLGTSRVSNVRVNGGGLLDLRGDYIQPDSNEGVIESNLLSRIQLSGNSEQRIVFPAGRRVHLHNLHIRNEPSRYTISNGLNTYSFADAIANQPNSPRIWTNLLFDIEEVTIPNIPLPDDDDEEFDLPNNTGMLAWPADSGEVTLWFGIVDEIFQEIHNGIDIQDEIGAPVYSISDGVVTDIYNDPFFGDVVTIDFLYYGEHKQAKYCYLDVIEVSIGETVAKGQIIGTMSEHESVRKGHLELRLYKNGVAIDPVTFMVRPDFDLSFLHYPMATSLFTLRRNIRVEDYRFERNYDLYPGEVYFRRWAHEYANRARFNMTSTQFSDGGYLTWFQERSLARFWFKTDNLLFDANLMIDVYIPRGWPLVVPQIPQDVRYIRARGRIVNDRVAVMVDRLFPGEGEGGTRIDLDANMGIVIPPYVHRIPGIPMMFQEPLPEPTRGGGHTIGHRFVGWFDTVEPFGNTRFTNMSIIPDSPIRLFARWNDPTRHDTYWYHRERVSISLRGLNSYYRPLVTTAVNNWNEALEGNSSVRFDTDPSSRNWITIRATEEPDHDYFGFLIRQDGRNDSQLTRFEVEIYTAVIRNYANRHGNYENVFKATVVHELGHAVGLRDNPICTDGNNIDSVMIYGRRWSDYESSRPTDFDIESVKMLYD